MEHAIVTRGHLTSSNTIILDEQISKELYDVEVIIKPIMQTKTKRKAGTLQGLIHISNDFDSPLEDFKEYMQ